MKPPRKIVFQSVQACQIGFKLLDVAEDLRRGCVLSDGIEINSRSVGRRLGSWIYFYIKWAPVIEIKNIFDPKNVSESAIMSYTRILNLKRLEKYYIFQ